MGWSEMAWKFRAIEGLLRFGSFADAVSSFLFYSYVIYTGFSYKLPSVVGMGVDEAAKEIKYVW